MIGIDTSFLVAFEVQEHPRRSAAHAFARDRRAEGFAIAPQVLTEFCHIVTDPRRFERPFEMVDALSVARRWWNAQEVTVVSPDRDGGSRFLDLMREHMLGRKRLLDTMLAATYIAAGIGVIATLDARDFARFPGIAPIIV